MEEQIEKVKNPAKKWKIFLIFGICGIVVGISCLLFSIFGLKKDTIEAITPEETKEEPVYSALTGEPLADKSKLNAPAYCIQTPNGLDGARPQVGLTQAGVVFEAIAEAGITRFAAIYQDPTSAIIGPIRSLRPYYLEWDTPFDCTIVHAGGSQAALAAVSAGGYKDLSESTQYMYRGTYSSRLWNNLFTTSEDLKQFSKDHSYDTSNIKGFARMTPKESNKYLAENLSNEPLDITKPSTGNTSEVSVEIPKISLNLNSSPGFNIVYTYDSDSNTYKRSYADGAPHEVYKCTNENLGQKDPEDVCTLTTMAPSVVIAMIVNESRAADGYYEEIKTTGTGKAYIFQNGTVIEATWDKSSAQDQIKFTDKDGKEVKLTPGQTFISAVPGYGSVDY